MAADEDRNPSPPINPEAEIFFSPDDNVGSTVFNKRFVLRTLLELKEQITNASVETRAPEELDSDLEESLSKLWDMTVEPDVARFLFESHSLEIFLAILATTNKPRLAEILVGVQANMVCLDDCGETMASDENFVSTILSLLSCRDTETLIQVLRLLLSVAQSKLWSSLWESEFRSLHCWDDISFILASTRNQTLLASTAQFVDFLLDLESSSLASEHLLKQPPESVACLFSALNEAESQHNIAALTSVFHCLHLLAGFQSADLAAAIDSSFVSNALRYLEIFANETNSWANWDTELEQILPALASLFSLMRSSQSSWVQLCTKETDSTESTVGEAFQLMNSIQDKIKDARNENAGETEYLTKNMIDLLLELKRENSATQAPKLECLLQELTVLLSADRQ